MLSLLGLSWCGGLQVTKGTYCMILIRYLHQGVKCKCCFRVLGFAAHLVKVNELEIIESPPGEIVVVILHFVPRPVSDTHHNNANWII